MARRRYRRRLRRPWARHRRGHPPPEIVGSDGPQPRRGGGHPPEHDPRRRPRGRARAEAQEIADRTTKAAEAAAADLRAQAKAEADRIRERGRADAQQLHDQALAQLRGELASMVVLAASRVLGREVSPERHRELIERSLDEAGAELSGEKA